MPGGPPPPGWHDGEGTRTLPGNYDLSLAYGFNDVDGDTGEIGYLSRHTASAWGTKTFRGDCFVSAPRNVMPSLGYRL